MQRHVVIVGTDYRLLIHTLARFAEQFHNALEIKVEVCG